MRSAIVALALVGCTPPASSSADECAARLRALGELDERRGNALIDAGACDGYELHSCPAYVAHRAEIDARAIEVCR